MQAALVIYAAALCQMTLFVASTWALATAVAARVTEVQLGYPPLVKVRRPNVVLRAGPIPMTASCGLLGRAEESDDPRGWWRLPLPRRLLVILGPWAATFAAAIACLGPARAGRSFAHAAAQLLWTPDLTPLMRRFVALAEHASFATTLGVVLVKLTFMNLLPLASLAGGQAIDDLRGRTSSAAWIIISMLVVLVWFTGRIGYAAIRAVL